MIDLHTHSYYSDGRFSPAALIQAASDKGLRALAITDHDNTRGSREAAPIASAAGIGLVPAIEMTTSWAEADLLKGDQDVDLLGYFINLEDPAFRAYEEGLLADIHERIGDTCGRMSKAGIPLTLEQVFAENPRYAGAVQSIHALIHTGSAPGWDEALRLFNLYWIESRPSRFPIQSAIEAVHNAGGVAVLAHPTIVRPGGRVLSADILRPLVDLGLDGLEVYHHRLDDEMREYFGSLAHHFNLLITGGSDMHGWHNDLSNLGREPVQDEMLERLRQRAGAGGNIDD